MWNVSGKRIEEVEKSSPAGKPQIECRVDSPPTQIAVALARRSQG